MAGGRHEFRRTGRFSRRRQGWRAARAVGGAASVAAGIGIVAHLTLFFVHSSSAGSSLIGQERQAIAAAAASPGACQATAPGAARVGAKAGSGEQGRPDGLLEVPVLGLVAPVLQGTTDAVLDDAVGHDPASAWPGDPGTSVLSAHDVTWFSRIGQLRPGSEIRYVTPCRTYTFQVTSHAIVHAGDPVYNTGQERLVLDTCYPLDALYITSTRYLLFSSLVASAPTHASAAVPAAWQPPSVPAPPGLAAQGLSLAGNPAPLGTLRLAGSPARTWAQSSAPLDFEAAALAEYFGLIRSAAQRQSGWWADLAPGVPSAAAGTLWGGRIDSYGESLQVVLRAVGTRAAGATLSTSVTATGPDGSAGYDLSVTETVTHDRLHVTRVQVAPVAS